MKRIFRIFLCLILLINAYPVHAEDINPNLNHIAVNNEVVPQKELLNVSVKDGDTVKIGGVGNPKDLIGIVLNGTTYSKTIDGNGNWFVMFSILNMNNGKHTVYLKYDNGKENEILTNITVQGSEATDTTVEVDEKDTEFLGSTLYYIVVAISIPLLISFGWFLNVFFQKFSKK